MAEHSVKKSPDRYYGARKNLLNRAYKYEHLDRGLARYWCWEVGENFVIYTSQSGDRTSKVFIDGLFIDLFKLLIQVEGITPPKLHTTTPNQKFERFLYSTIDGRGTKAYGGWKLSFKNEQAFERFLDICEKYARGGIKAAEDYALNIPKKALPATSKIRTNTARIGQAGFRGDLIKYWKGCSVTGCDILTVLKASHIKPWSSSSPTERLDPNNGLLLIATLDALFDSGLITFNEDGFMLISSKVDPSHYSSLGVDAQLKLRKLNIAHLFYLKHHRENIFIA